jgi:uncharacterized protein YbjQ (UPF0145 family)
MPASDAEEPSDMILSTSETIAGREITETIGLVRGNSARARGLG